jgi:putative tryptophan/tyrosine transport system substrate-binding protein
MRRRDFIAALGGAAAWPLAARAQQPAMPVIGFLRSAPLSDASHLVTAFRQGLKETGFVEGQNVVVEFGSGENDRDRLAGLITAFIHRPVDVIVGNVAASVAAKAATTTVPIVFATGSDPIQDGLVTSLNRPGGNVTGVNFFSTLLGAKRVEVLRQLVPTAKTISVLVGPECSVTVAERKEVQAAAQTLGLQLVIVHAESDRDIETAFATFVQRGAGAIFVGGGAFMFSNREPIVALAARHALPASYANREFVLAGGLTSYSASISEAYRQAGIYAGRILKGERPGDLPVMRSTKFEFVINLKTAKTLGLEFHPQLLATADEVIE